MNWDDATITLVIAAIRDWYQQFGTWPTPYEIRAHLIARQHV